MTDLSDFTQQIAPDVIGCPDPLIDRSLLTTIMDFCKKTWILSKTVSITITSGDINSDLNNSVTLDLSSYLDSNTKILAIKQCLFDEVVYPMDFLEAGSDSAYIKSFTDKKFFSFPTDSTILIYPINGSCIIDLEVIITPTLSASAVDDRLYDKYLDAITAGTKARLFRQPDKKWTSLELVPYYDRVYRRAVVEARRSVKKEFTGESLSVRPRRFGEIDYYDHSTGFVFE